MFLFHIIAIFLGKHLDINTMTENNLLFLFLLLVYVFLLLVYVFLLLVYVFLLLVYVFLLLSMYSYC